VKNDISVYIDIESKLLGIVDALMLGFLGVGHFMHAVRSIKKPVYSLYIGMVLCGINFTLIPLFMKLSLSWGNFLILCILMSFNGFLQSYTWPNLLMIIHSKFDPEKYTVLLGFWATNANVGNIIGYALSILLIAVGCDSCWELQLIIAAIYAIINGFIIGVRFTEIPVAMIENLRKKSF
jgi:sugar phosphate permease